MGDDAVAGSGLNAVKALKEEGGEEPKVPVAPSEPPPKGDDENQSPKAKKIAESAAKAKPSPADVKSKAKGVLTEGLKSGSLEKSLTSAKKTISKDAVKAKAKDLLSKAFESGSLEKALPKKA